MTTPKVDRARARVVRAAKRWRATGYRTDAERVAEMALTDAVNKLLVAEVEHRRAQAAARRRARRVAR